MTLLGAVLAGGLSQRFGSDKAVAHWRGRPLIEHVVAAVLPHVDALVVCGRDMPIQHCIADRPAPGLGPLAGICAALCHAADHGFDRVLTLPCDVPALSVDVLRLLLAETAPAYLDELPVIGLWPAAAGDALERRLATDARRAVRRWAADIGAWPLQLPDELAPVNVNHRAELNRLDERS